MEWKSSPLDKARKFQSKFTVAVPTPVAIAGIAAGSFAISSVTSIVLRKIPVVGKLIVG